MARAARESATVDLADAESVQARLGELAARRRRLIRLWRTGAVVLNVALGLLACLTFAISAALGVILFVLLALCVPASAITLAVVESVIKSQRYGSEALLRSSDIRSVGSLFEALWYGDREIRDLAAQALIELLPRLKASDGMLLNETHRSYLYFGLTPAGAIERPHLVVAILRALEQIGDEVALPHVRKLANRDSGCYPPVLEAAWHCLKALEERVDRQKLHASLLRASAAPEDIGLLRPAAAAESAVEQLLRPVHD